MYYIYKTFFFFFFFWIFQLVINIMAGDWPTTPSYDAPVQETPNLPPLPASPPPQQQEAEMTSEPTQSAASTSAPNSEETTSTSQVRLNNASLKRKRPKSGNSNPEKPVTKKHVTFVDGLVDNVSIPTTTIDTTSVTKTLVTPSDVSVENVSTPTTTTSATTETNPVDTLVNTVSSLSLQTREAATWPSVPDEELSMDGIPENYEFSGTAKASWPIIRDFLMNSEKFMARSTLYHNLAVKKTFPMWVTGAEKIPPHLLPQPVVDDYVELVRIHSIERMKFLSSRLRKEGEYAREVANHQIQACFTILSLEEDKRVFPLLVNRCQKVNRQRLSQKLSKQETSAPSYTKEEIIDALFEEDPDGPRFHTQTRGRNPGNRSRSRSPRRPSYPPRNGNGPHPGPPQRNQRGASHHQQHQGAYERGPSQYYRGPTYFPRGPAPRHPGPNHFQRGPMQHQRGPAPPPRGQAHYQQSPAQPRGPPNHQAQYQRNQNYRNQCQHQGPHQAAHQDGLTADELRQLRGLLNKN